MGNIDNLRDVLPLILAVMEDEQAQIEEMMMTAARLAAAELMELEEGEGLDDLVGNVWEPVAVDINEYHSFGDVCFRLHFRMSRRVFESLTAVIYNHLEDRGRVVRNRRPFQDAVLMVVWLMATPDCFRSVALRFGVTPSTLYYFYSYIIQALTELAATYITWPDAEERAHISNAFERATGFSGVAGCIDCTHINITAPLEDAGQYINRHHAHSVNVQAVVDHTLRVRQLHVGEVGSMNDNRVFRRSPLHHDLLHSEPGVAIGPDEHLVGDGAYRLTSFMMVPYPHNAHRTERQRNFNRRLSQCRVRVENAFARAKGKWRRLKFLHVRNPRNLVEHITASFVLHNFLILHGEQMFDEEELARPINDNQILEGIENQLDDDVPEEEELLQEAAEARGEEKRLFFTDHLLPLPELEEEEDADDF